MRLVNFTQVDDERRTGDNKNCHLRRINPEYVVSVKRWTDKSSEILLDIRSTVERVTVLGELDDVVKKLEGE
jgi:hypothetical protein